MELAVLALLLIYGLWLIMPDDKPHRNAMPDDHDPGWENRKES